MNLKIKKIFKINMLITMLLVCLFSNIIFAETNYDIVNLNATNYNYDPAPLESGDDFELWIQLTNNSNTTAENISYELDLEYPFNLAEFENSQNIISTIAPYQTKIIKYKLRSEIGANPGTYELKFKYQREGLEVYNIEKYTIDIVSQETIVDIVDSSIEDTYIGQKTKIELELKNLSNKTAKNIFVTLEDSKDEEIKVMDLKTKFIDKLENEENQKIVFYILAGKNIFSKTYTLPINITYSGNNIEYEINRNIGIEIIDNPNILINTLNNSDNLNIESNSENKLELEIFNVGNIDAESLYVELESEIIKNSNKYFVGNIEKDNYDTVDIEFTTKDIKEGQNQIDIIVHYKDGNLKEKQIVKTINVNVLNKENEGLGIQMIFSSILSIVGLIVGLAFFIIVLKWLYKILVKPAYKDVMQLFKKKKK